MRIAIAGATGRIGSQLAALARKEGHDVVEIARETGFDLLAPTGLEEALAGVDAVVDVTAAPLEVAGEFFPAVARNLGSAAAAAGSKAKVCRVLHPSPASPAANRGWAEAATNQLAAAGVW